MIGDYDALLDEFMPPSLLVNERRELVHAFGGAEPLPAAAATGGQSLDVLDMVDAGPQDGADRRAAARAEGARAVVYNGLRLTTAGGEERVPADACAAVRAGAEPSDTC